MNKKLIWITAASVIVVALALPKILPAPGKSGPSPGAPAEGKSAKKARTDKGLAPSTSGQGKGGPVAVRAQIVKPEPLSERLHAPGTVLANEAIELKSEIAGRLVYFQVQEGGRVSKGALIAKINDADLQAQLLKAESNLKMARDMEERQKGLYEKEVISIENYQSAQRGLESAKADVALVQAQIDKTEIRAPFAGLVGLKAVSVGAYLSAGSKLTTLVNDRPLKIDFALPGKYAGRVLKGSSIELIAQNGKKYRGSVYAIDPLIDENTRSLRLRGLCTNPDGGIVPGAFVEVALIMGDITEALMVPTPAIVPDATGQKVFCVKDGKAVPIPVTIGVRDSTKVQITSGLKAGDTVITSGVLLLRPGSLITVTLE